LRLLICHRFQLAKWLAMGKKTNGLHPVKLTNFVGS
jgi:hypothetical protein